MTESNPALTELPALLEEKRRYESWLDALDARREATPGHVFDRVQADYRARLQHVTERLAAHRNALAEERASLESRLALVEAEEKMRRDEHAELDLRVHVGELAREEGADALKSLGATLEQLSAERDELRKKLDALGKLTAPAAEGVTAPVMAPVTAPGEATVKASETAAPAEPNFDELAFLNSVVKQTPSPPADAKVEKSEEAERPLAANVPANTPIVLRASGAFEQSKSLKCNECGAMNYPTEWYCERCGAELAAL